MDKYWQKRGQGGCLVAGVGLFGCMAESQGTNVKRMGKDGRSWAARSKELGRHFLSNAATRSRWIWKRKEENTSELTMARNGEQKQDVDTLPTSKRADHFNRKDHFAESVWCP